MNKFIKDNIKPVSKIIARKLKISSKTVETVLLLGIPILLDLVSNGQKTKSHKKKRKAKRRHKYKS